MYNIYCDDINTLGYERKQNAYIVLLLKMCVSMVNISTHVSNYSQVRFKDENIYKCMEFSYRCVSRVKISTHV